MKKLSDRDKIDIIKLYLTKKHTLKELALKFSVSPQAVSQFLKRRGVKNCSIDNNGRFSKIYSINDNYFDKIDNEYKAYFLGLLYADGYNNGKGVVEIGLQERDKLLLEKLNENIQNTSPLIFKERNNKNKNHQNIYRLFLRSEQICKSLIKLGCVPKKTFLLKFPSYNQVPKKLIRHFLRGYWDGDGYIGLNKRGKYTVVSANVVGVYDFCLGIQNFIMNSIKICIPMCDASNKKNKVLYITSRKNTKLVLDFLYKDSSIYLDRKYKKYQEIASIVKI